MIKIFIKKFALLDPISAKYKFDLLQKNMLNFGLSEVIITLLKVGELSWLLVWKASKDVHGNSSNIFKNRNCYYQTDDQTDTQADFEIHLHR